MVHICCLNTLQHHLHLYHTSPPSPSSLDPKRRIIPSEYGGGHYQGRSTILYRDGEKKRERSTSGTQRLTLFVCSLNVFFFHYRDTPIFDAYISFNFSKCSSFTCMKMESTHACFLASVNRALDFCSRIMTSACNIEFST